MLVDALSNTKQLAIFVAVLGLIIVQYQFISINYQFLFFLLGFLLVYASFPIWNELMHIIFVTVYGRTQTNLNRQLTDYE
jgi:hypothetical protein